MNVIEREGKEESEDGKEREGIVPPCRLEKLEDLSI